MDYLNAAQQFIKNYFPDCSFALVAGSLVRGEGTSTSDLDIFIIDTNLESAYRESFYEYGWPIEAFIHSLESYQDFFQSDVKRRRPSLPKMVSEGIVLKDHLDIEHELKSIANNLLEKGPKPFSQQEMDNERYAITDMLDDLIGSKVYEEDIFIINELSEKMINFILVNRGQWMGRGKWLPKLLKKLDEKLYIELLEAMNRFCMKKDKVPFIRFIKRELNNYGGRLFEGYHIGKRRN